MKRHLSPDELVVEACLWALEGCRPATIAQILGVAPHAVASALKKSGAWFIVYPGAGRRKRLKYWFFPEADRERLAIPYNRFTGEALEAIRTTASSLPGNGA